MKSLKLLVVTLSIAMLMAVSACASPPPPTPAPTPIPVYTPNFTEAEVIALARGGSKCWLSPKKGCKACPAISNYTHTPSASLKKNGLWLVTAYGEWIETYTADSHRRGEPPQKYYAECTLLLDDATGLVIPR